MCGGHAQRLLVDLLSRSLLEANIKCVLSAQFLTLASAPCHQDTAVGPLRERVKRVCLQVSLLCRPQPYIHATKVNSFLTDALQTWDCGLQSHPAQHKGIWAKCPERLLHHLRMPGRRARKAPGMGSQSYLTLLQPSSTKIQRAVGEQTMGGKPCHASPMTPRHITEPQEMN